MIKKIFLEEIIPSVKNGEIIIKETDEYTSEPIEFTYNVKYNKDYTDDLTIPTLQLKDERTFFELLEEYVGLMSEKYPKNDRINSFEYIKKIIGLLFVNGTYGDFLNPNEYLIKRINFLKNENYINNEMNLNFNENEITVSCNTEKQDIMLETPYVFASKLNIDQVQLELPKISYGISDNICYIYSIQNCSNNIEGINLNKLLKKTKSDIDEEYSGYYKNKLRNVTPSFVLALTCFLKVLKENGIDEMKVVPFLPVRYNAKSRANEKRAKLKAGNEEEYLSLLEQLNLNQINIQKNVTDKFLRTFEKIEYMTDCLNINLRPLEYDDMMHIKIVDYKRCDNELLGLILDAPLDNITKRN